MDEMLKSPQGQKDIKKHSAAEESQPSIFGRPQTDNIALYTGCTAVVMLCTDTEIIVANSGDSRAVLCKDGKCLEMSFDHKPDNAEEKARIEKAGGFVEENRVKGVLNLSRSLGDLEYKQDPKLSVENQMITCVPEVRVEQYNTNCDFMLIACDGIWDCLTSPEGIDFCKDYIKGNPTALLAPCCEQMFDKIIATDVASSGGIGCDNMTAVVVQFKH